MIEFQYFEGCPHAEDTLKNLREVMADMGIGETELHIVEVPDAAYAQKLNFQGSPGILVGGADIYTGLKPEGFNYQAVITRDFNKPKTNKGLSSGIALEKFLKRKENS